MSGQQGARLAFQLRCGRGQTEEQALPPDRPQAASVAFSMPVQLGKVAGTDRDPIPAAPHVRRLAREIGVNIRSVVGSGPGGRISEDDVKQYAKSALMQAAAAAQTRAEFSSSPNCRLRQVGKTERVSMRGVRRKPPSIFGRRGTRFRTLRSRIAPTSRNWNSCAPNSRLEPRKLAAR